ncbi:MAG: Sir2 family NAD-dependent protein deacetylase [Lachnotalea sp.]
MEIKELEKLIQDAENIVCIGGRGMAYDCGYPKFWSQEYSYYIENKYGRSVEEIFNIGFYSIRSKEFFEFYKEEVLKFKFKPSAAHYKLAQLEKSGKLKCTITKASFYLAQRAGCKNVIDIYGNISENYCPKCGQRYSIEYIIQSKGLPRCLECNTEIRPEIKMYGEMIDNNRVTKAIEAIATADMLLILDTGYDGEFKDYISHYQGNKAVIIKENVHESDRNADYIIYDKSKNVLSKLSDEKIHIMFEKRDVVND